MHPSWALGAEAGEGDGRLSRAGVARGQLPALSPVSGAAPLGALAAEPEAAPRSPAPQPHCRWLWPAPAPGPPEPVVGRELATPPPGEGPAPQHPGRGRGSGSTEECRGAPTPASLGGGSGLLSGNRVVLGRHFPSRVSPSESAATARFHVQEESGRPESGPETSLLVVEMGSQGGSEGALRCWQVPGLGCTAAGGEGTLQAWWGLWGVMFGAPAGGEAPVVGVRAARDLTISPVTGVAALGPGRIFQVFELRAEEHAQARLLPPRPGCSCLGPARATPWGRGQTLQSARVPPV